MWVVIGTLLVLQVVTILALVGVAANSVASKRLDDARRILTEALVKTATRLSTQLDGLTTLLSDTVNCVHTLSGTTTATSMATRQCVAQLQGLADALITASGDLRSTVSTMKKSGHRRQIPDTH